MGAFLGSASEGEALMQPLRRLGPVLDTYAEQAPIGLADLAMDPRDPLPYRLAHALVDDLPAVAMDELAEIAGPGSALTMLQLRHSGGALGRRVPGAGARATLPGEICVLGLGVVPEPGAEPVIAAALGAVSAAVAPYRAGDYPNFVEEQTDTSAFFDADTWERLQRVKALYDPQDLFRGNHHIPPADRA